MSRSPSKKDATLWQRQQPKGHNDPSFNRLEQEAWLIYLFTLAEKRFPARFAELRRRAVPMYARHLDGKTVCVRIHHGQFNCCALVELERRIADWNIGLVGDIATSLNLLKCDPRTLAFRRVQSWYLNEAWPLWSAVGRGIAPLVVVGIRPGEEKKKFRTRVNSAIQEYLKETPHWRPKRAYAHHFEWLLRYLIGRETLAQIGQSEGRQHEASVVLRGIQRAAKLAGLPLYR